MRLGHPCRNVVLNTSDHCGAGHANRVRHLSAKTSEKLDVTANLPIEGKPGPIADMVPDPTHALSAENGKLPNGEDTHMLYAARALAGSSKRYLAGLANGESPQIPYGPYVQLPEGRFMAGKHGGEVITREGRITARGLLMFPYSHTLEGR